MKLKKKIIEDAEKIFKMKRFMFGHLAGEQGYRGTALDAMFVNRDLELMWLKSVEIAIQLNNRNSSCIVE